jgi:hypothetical protein
MVQHLDDGQATAAPMTATARPATAARTHATAPIPLPAQENNSHPLVSFTEPITSTRGMAHLEALRESILAASEAARHYTS